MSRNHFTDRDFTDNEVKCGSPAGTGGSGTKNSECETGRESSNESAFPQIPATPVNFL